MKISEQIADLSPQKLRATHVSPVYYVYHCAIVYVAVTDSCALAAEELRPVDQALRAGNGEE